MKILRDILTYFKIDFDDIDENHSASTQLLLHSVLKNDTPSFTTLAIICTKCTHQHKMSRLRPIFIIKAGAIPLRGSNN